MARYSGKVGYGHPTEAAAGVFIDAITEKEYYGDVDRSARRTEDGPGANSNIAADNIHANTAARNRCDLFCCREASFENKLLNLLNRHGGEVFGRRQSIFYDFCFNFFDHDVAC